MKWSPEDIEVLKKYYPEGGSAEVSKHLTHKRYPGTIVCKARSLGLAFLGSPRQFATKFESAQDISVSRFNNGRADKNWGRE